MDNKEEIRKELSELSRRLEKIENKNPFGVPDYYFQSLPDKMIEKVKGSARPVLWTDKLESLLNNFFSIIFRPRYAIPAAALLLAVVAGINFLKTVQDFPLVTQPLSEISSEEINEYVIENFDDADFIAFKGLEDRSENFILKDISKEELENFIDNNSDNQTLEEEIL